jgi:hypothetical protein
MTVRTLERTPLERLRRILGGDDTTEMSLPTELFLIAHDDETGRRHVWEHILRLGLAAAVLLEVWLTKRIRIGWHDNVREATLTRDPGRITVLDASPTGDRIVDTALALLSRSGGTLRLHDFVTQYADTGLYERIQADLIAAGIIHRTTHKRFWFFRRHNIVPTKDAYPVRARGRIRTMVNQYRAGIPKHDPRALALSALVTTLGLTRHLYQDEAETPTSALNHWLHNLVGSLTDPTISDIAATIRQSK